MTEYSDLPAVNTLYGENERTQQALDMLAAGGTMSNFTIAPPPMTNTMPPAGGSMMMMAVSISVTEPLSDEMITALNDWLTTRQQNILTELATYDVGPPPPPVTEAPVNTVAPVVAQADTMLTCTTGTWDNSPTAYAYEWTKDGAVIGGSTPSYSIAFADVGSSFVCTVSATNNIGTATGLTSNTVVVVSPP